MIGHVILLHANTIPIKAWIRRGTIIWRCCWLLVCCSSRSEVQRCNPESSHLPQEGHSKLDSGLFHRFSGCMTAPSVCFGAVRENEET